MDYKEYTFFKMINGELILIDGIIKDYNGVYYKNDTKKTVVYDFDKNRFKPLIKMWYHQFRNSFLTFMEKVQIFIFVIFIIISGLFFYLIGNANNQIIELREELNTSLINVKNVDYVSINSFTKWAVEKYNIEQYTGGQLYLNTQREQNKNDALNTLQGK